MGSLPRTSSGNQLVLAKMDCYTKITRAIWTSQTAALPIVSMLLDQWTISYKTPDYELTDHETHAMREFFESLCAFLGAKHSTPAAHHFQTNGQAERFNKMIIAWLRQYEAENHGDWDIYVQSLTYANNTKVHRTRNLPTFSLILS